MFVRYASLINSNFILQVQVWVKIKLPYLSSIVSILYLKAEEIQQEYRPHEYNGTVRAS